MTAHAPSRGIVCLAALDLRRTPDHRSELTSQLLSGEVVRILGLTRDRQWCRVENRADGYRGWARGWGLTPASTLAAARWTRRARARVRVSTVEARMRPGGGPLVSPLFWNARLIPGGRRGRHREVVLADGRRAWVPASALDLGRSRPPSLISRVRDLLGVPYLWGGRTPLGFDCSGFTQQVLAEQGVRLPRDAQHQFERGLRVPDGALPRAGDLVFFGRAGRPVGHVGLALGGSYFAHARGWVRISSLESSNPLCDRELDGSYRGCRRPRRPRLRPDST